MAEQVRHSKPVRMAAAAYQAALAHKWDAAWRMVQRISDECAGEGLATALMAWCDTLVLHATGGQNTPVDRNVGFIEAGSGRYGEPGAGDVPPHVDWAGRLIAARGAMDKDRWQAVIGELPDDGHEIGRYVGQVLQMVALTVNGLPRGYMRMGREEATGG